MLLVGTLVIGMSLLAIINLIASTDIFQLTFWQLVPVTLLGVLLLEVPQTIFNSVMRRVYDRSNVAT